MRCTHSCRARGAPVLAAILTLLLSAACSYSTESTLQRQARAPGVAGTATASPVTVTTGSVPGEPLGPESKVFIRGIGAVEAGMPVAEASVAAGHPLEPVSGRPNPTCHRVAPVGGPDGVRFVVVDGTIATVEVEALGITTRSSAGVGITASRLQELYGSRIEDEVGEVGERLLVFVPSDPADEGYRMVFVLEDDVVVRYRAGRLPEVAHTDPCG